MEQRERQMRFAVTVDGEILMTKPSDEEAAGYVDFSVLEDGTARLLRWPRNTTVARLTEMIGGYQITEIAPLAFAAFHFSKELFCKICAIPASLDPACRCSAKSAKQTRMLLFCRMYHSYCRFFRIVIRTSQTTTRSSA